MDEPLFDLDVPVIITGRNPRTVMVEQAWQSWCSITARPDSNIIPDKFRLTYSDLLRRNYDHDDMLLLIRGAARMQPRPRDPSDTRRLFNPLTNFDHDRVARNALEADLPIILYTNPLAAVNLSTIKDLENACDTSMSNWTDNDIEAAGILMKTTESETLLKLGQDVALRVGRPGLFPMDLLRWQGSVSRTKPKASAHRNSYTSGTNEQIKTEEILFEADRKAAKMLLNGDSVEDILAYHKQAPLGYWDAVLNALGDVPTHAQAYDALRDRFNWHPNERH